MQDLIVTAIVLAATLWLQRLIRRLGPVTHLATSRKGNQVQKELVMKIVVGTASIAAIVTVIGVPVWGFSPLVIAAAALLAAVSVVRILFPDRR